ncbi:CDP-glucose 4,6-dehydratase [Alphaproteobacteria bacterium]|nr:CDP-glucose 4,6-dehydratase [Alphaproteobacteria bacterium]
MIDKVFWKGRKVFLTGHTGFKGGWLGMWLSQLGAEVKGYSLEAPTTPCLYEEARIFELVQSDIGDIRDFSKLKNSMECFCPDLVIHMAAQPLVRHSYEEPLETFSVNVLGTVNVLEAARKCSSVKAVVNITTDKCYKNNEWEWAYRENEPMGGHDPYSGSKGCAELVTASYKASFYQEKGIGLASARAGNVIGGGDWAKDRLIPDILSAFEKNQTVAIRSPKAIRPWQHVLEPLSGYILLAQSVFDSPEKYSEAWNFGPYDEDSRPVSWIMDRMVSLWPGASWSPDVSCEHPHEAKYLKLDISKANTYLHWRPTWQLNKTLIKIVDWHQLWLSGADMQLASLKEINEFSEELEACKRE